MFRYLTEPRFNYFEAVTISIMAIAISKGEWLMLAFVILAYALFLTVLACFCGGHK